ncbi:hypothetical protein [Aliiroseovarius sp. PrR006]|uniref:hypothetical protein n=1 Tax=Aliiroseovarius sp. PrR006 TaxID=2706883 RepID=UPI0013D068C8|nr:hypothetical protein [Aliiroseovarius sp. PrR006]NDW52508.1 hypothetical protein [Aliiroseovarius sp. PrR006]
MRHFIQLSACLYFLASSGNAWADDNQTIPLAAAGEGHCATEWAALMGLGATTQLTDPVEYDGTLDPDTSATFGKYADAVVALSEYEFALIALIREAQQSKQQFDLVRARFDLAMCLMPSQTERDLITAASMRVTDRSESETRELLFRPFDSFLCLKMGTVSRKIFALDPLASDFRDQAIDISISTIRPCDET